MSARNRIFRLFLLAAFALNACSVYAGSDEREPAPRFRAKTLTGENFTNDSVKGKVVLLYFWATWCPYCRRELPAGVERISRERKAQPFAVLAVNIEEPRDLVASWVKGAGLTMPVLLDYDGAVARDYRVTATPTIYLIGRDGRLVARAAGTREWESSAGRALLDALVAAPPK
jgi:thiol-disulfide isomerase/thioredoxin